MLPNTRKPPCRLMPFMIAAIPNSRIPNAIAVPLKSSLVTRSVNAVPAQTYSGAVVAGSMRLYAVTLCAVDDASTDTPTPVSGLVQADGCAGALRDGAEESGSGRFQA